MKTMDDCGLRIADSINRKIRETHERGDVSISSFSGSRISRVSRFTSPIRNRVGFTLLELLMVVAIIGILATVALPHLTGFGKSNAITAATRQLLDDVAFARQKAMATRTPVYMVFIKDNFEKDRPLDDPQPNSQKLLNCSGPVQQQVNDLTRGGQLTSYALLSLRSVGDQPGQNNAKYWTSWRTLPKGVFISTNNFDTNYINKTVYLDDTNINFYRMNFRNFPFPSIADKQIQLYLPFIAFAPSGALLYPNTGSPANPASEYLMLSQGSVMTFTNGYPPEVVEIPHGNSTNYSYNLIHIDAMTGRAKLERREIK